MTDRAQLRITQQRLKALNEETQLLRRQREEENLEWERTQQIRKERSPRRQDNNEDQINNKGDQVEETEERSESEVDGEDGTDVDEVAREGVEEVTGEGVDEVVGEKDKVEEEPEDIPATQPQQKTKLPKVDKKNGELQATLTCEKS